MNWKDGYIYVKKLSMATIPWTRRVLHYKRWGNGHGTANTTILQLSTVPAAYCSITHITNRKRDPFIYVDHHHDDRAECRLTTWYSLRLRMMKTASRCARIAYALAVGRQVPTKPHHEMLYIQRFKFQWVRWNEVDMRSGSEDVTSLHTSYSL
jgi:hypothetical protein